MTFTGKFRAIKYDGWERLEDRPAYLRVSDSDTVNDLVERADPRMQFNSASDHWVARKSKQPERHGKTLIWNTDHGFVA